jgi:hypothetical protein
MGVVYKGDDFERFALIRQKWLRALRHARAASGSFLLEVTLEGSTLSVNLREEGGSMSHAPQPVERVSPEKTSRLSALAASIESVMKVSAVTAAVLYGIGVIVTNVYLSQFGIVDFSVLKAQCLLTGTVAVFVIAMASVPGVFML